MPLRVPSPLAPPVARHCASLPPGLSPPGFLGARGPYPRGRSAPRVSPSVKAAGSVAGSLTMRTTVARVATSAQAASVTGGPASRPVAATGLTYCEGSGVCTWLLNDATNCGTCGNGVRQRGLRRGDLRRRRLRGGSYLSVRRWAAATTSNSTPTTAEPVALSARAGSATRESAPWMTRRAKWISPSARTLAPASISAQTRTTAVRVAPCARAGPASRRSARHSPARRG